MYNQIIDKQKVADLELSTIMDIINEFGLEYVETTNDSSGYPSVLKWAITSDSIAELMQIEEELSDCGFSTQQVELRRKHGWQLWARHNTSIHECYFQIIDDSDTVLHLNFENKKEMKENIQNLIYFNSDEVDSKDYGFETPEEHVADIIEYLPTEGEGLVYFNEDCDYDAINIVKNDDAFDSKDNYDFKLGIILI